MDETPAKLNPWQAGTQRPIRPWWGTGARKTKTVWPFGNLSINTAHMRPKKKKKSLSVKFAVNFEKEAFLKYILRGKNDKGSPPPMLSKLYNLCFQADFECFSFKFLKTGNFRLQFVEKQLRPQPWPVTHMLMYTPYNEIMRIYKLAYFW